MIECLVPSDLPSLFAAFARLEAGHSVALCSEHPGSLPAAHPSLGLFSSGSTGHPNLVWHRWPDLSLPRPPHLRYAGWTWASPFDPRSFAGVQVALQAWHTKGQAFSLSTNVHSAWPQLANSKPQALCCTPTFLDLLLQAEVRPFPWVPLQVTLGGEPLRPNAGQRFRARFPDTRFTIIYASAEFGVLLKTADLDGWYELEELDRRNFTWRIREESLEINFEGLWRTTGDRVERRGNRIRILGRIGAVANVAGTKVSLQNVASAAEEVNGVRSAVARSESNPITGQIVVLRFTPADGSDPSEVQGRLEDHLRNRLPKEAWPRRFEIGALELGPNSKALAG